VKDLFGYQESGCVAVLLILDDAATRWMDSVISGRLRACARDETGQLE